MEQLKQQRPPKNIIGDKYYILDIAIRNACEFAGIVNGTKKDAIDIMYMLLNTIPMSEKEALWEWARTGGELCDGVGCIVEKLRRRVFNDEFNV